MLPGEHERYTSIFIIKKSHMLGGRCCAPQWHDQKYFLLGTTLRFIKMGCPGSLLEWCQLLHSHPKN